ncbi:MAG: sulfatase-like hydrolase/transferase [Verrucomicrobiota bacterium]|nr:sulfatase-like hydrolase/transferase [Verrucomicrobiota bacterium]
MNNKILFCGFLISLCSCLSVFAQPNILWISAEDIGPHFGCYGDPHAITPNIDQLSAEGTRYTNAYTTAGVCAPCRSGIITGMYQNSIGTHHMRCNAVLPSWLKPFPVLLRQSGYYCTNNSKTDYQFSRPSTGEIWDQNGSKAHWKNRKKGQPFFAVFNYTGCHESGIASEGKYRAVTGKLKPEQRQDPAKLDTLPPYYPDTPVVREDWKRNYELITAMDAWAGSLIKEIKDAGLYEETIIFFWADHGVGLPRAKRWLYGSGTHIPLIVRVPGKEGGQIDTQLVSSVDLGPTVLNLAGIEVPDKLQGRAFIGEKLSAPRRFVFGARDRMDERYDIIRSIFDGRYRYIRNFEPLKPYYQYMNTPEKGATMREIRRAEKEGTLTQTGKIFSTDKKPVEELYDFKSDPHEIRNLASDPDHSIILKKMRSNLAQWQSEIGDIGLIPEAEIEIREKKAGSRFEIMNGGLSDKNQVQRLVSIATKASQGNSALGELISAITDNDPVIRYWALTGIGNIGVAEDEVLELSKKAMKDESPNVRIAAARAVARLGDTDSALEVLRKELRSDHQWGRLAAAIVIDEMGEPGRKVVKDLKEVLSTRQPNKYILRVANRALNDLLGTENRVP